MTSWPRIVPELHVLYKEGKPLLLPTMVQKVQYGILSYCHNDIEVTLQLLNPVHYSIGHLPVSILTSVPFLSSEKHEITFLKMINKTYK